MHLFFSPFKPCSFSRQKWPGYNEWKRQFQTRDETPNRNPITIEKFVRHIGRSVDKFMSVSSLHFFWICYFCRIQFINRGFRVPFRNCTKLTLSGESGSMESPATTSSWSALCTSRRAAGCPSYSSIADYTKLTPEFHMAGNQHRLPAAPTMTSLPSNLFMWTRCGHLCPCIITVPALVPGHHTSTVRNRITFPYNYYARLCRLSTCQRLEGV